MAKLNQIFSMTAVTLGLIVLWQYAANVQAWTFKPSLVPTLFYTWFRMFFEGLGHYAAWCSSFLTYFQFNIIVQSIIELVEPCFQTVFSPIWFLKGYTDQMNLYDHPYLVIMGSSILILSVVATAYYFNLFNIRKLKNTSNRTETDDYPPSFADSRPGLNDNGRKTRSTSKNN